MPAAPMAVLRDDRIYAERPAAGLSCNGEHRLPVLAKAFRRRKRPLGMSWRMDETYIKVLDRSVLQVCEDEVRSQGVPSRATHGSKRAPLRPRPVRAAQPLGRLARPFRTRANRSSMGMSGRRTCADSAPIEGIPSSMQPKETHHERHEASPLQLHHLSRLGLPLRLPAALRATLAQTTCACGPQCQCGPGCTCAKS